SEGPTFESLGLDPKILKGIHDLGFIRPTPIQAKAIPPILEGRDLIGCAQTGTGKTAAFVLPILHRLLQSAKTRHVRALIVSPTREIAQQSIDHLNSLSKHVHLKGTAIYGGTPMNPQISALMKGLDIISATPGRLLDHVWSGRIDFRDLQILVLDEVDRMLDMGFLPDMKRIISLLPQTRQGLVFSATLPSEIQKLVSEILKNPVLVQIGQRSSAAAGIRHAVYPCPRHLKEKLLEELLRAQNMTSVIVFTRTKRLADKLSLALKRDGFKTSVLHGDRSQSQREQALAHFREGRSQVMVATDIAARGIDIADISHVINFDIPVVPEDYVHRIGRTARADATGDAFSLMDRTEEGMIKDIERILQKPLPRVTLPNFSYNVPPPPKSAHSQSSSPR
ncbi:MAG: RNA helicase, partial [Elusimicrobia bacterium RIFCSPLOWO2_01_FULL_54_10]